MADDGDHAKEWQDRHNAESLELALRSAKTKYQTGSDICIDCGDRISKERKEAVPHSVRCAECQNDSDKRTRGVGR